MKKIEAKIGPENFSGITSALAGIGIKGMTITDVKGLGREREQPGICRGRAYAVEVTAEIALELIVADEQTDEAVAAMVDTAKKLHLTVSALDQCGSENGVAGVFRGQPCRFKGNNAKRQIEMDVELS